MKKFALLFVLSGFAVTSLIAEDSAQVQIPAPAAPAANTPAPAATPNASTQTAGKHGKKHHKRHHKKKAETAPAPTP